MRKNRYSDIVPFKTKDGSLIRELMHPGSDSSVGQSLAEATVSAGASTLLHLHRKSEEIYHITAGSGVMRCGGEKFEIAEGDTVVIPPGTPHQLYNSGKSPLRLLCCCSPPYSDDDTELK